MPFDGSNQPSSSSIRDAFVIRAGELVPISRRQAIDRYLSAWAVVADWSKAPGVRFEKMENYRDYLRVVLVRSTPEGEQRLYLDPKNRFPVKLDFTEPHYLWGAAPH